MNNPLTIDVHEPTSIKIALKNLGIPIEVKSLEIGDYLFSNYIIERKTVSDLLNSIYKGRLYKQLYSLMKLEDYKPALFVIGEIPPKIIWKRIGKRRYQETLSIEEQKKKERVIISNLSLVYTSFNIPVYFANNNNQFILYLSNMYYRCNKNIKSLKPVKKIKRYSIEEIKSDMLSQIPLLGRKRADFLANKFSIKKLASMSIEELSKIPNLGDKISKKIIEVLTS